MVAEGERPQPWRSRRRRVHFYNAANHGAIGEHVEIVEFGHKLWVRHWAACESGQNDE
jgi:hypothetical protein